MAEQAIELRDVNKWFGDFHVLKNINLTVATDLIDFEKALEIGRVVRASVSVARVIVFGGPGIDTDVLDRVFEPFEQIPVATAPSTEGAGLGLSIAEELAQTNACDLKLENGRLGGLSATVSWTRNSWRKAA